MNIWGGENLELSFRVRNTLYRVCFKSMHVQYIIALHFYFAISWMRKIKKKIIRTQTFLKCFPHVPFFGKMGELSVTFGNVYCEVAVDKGI